MLQQKVRLLKVVAFSVVLAIALSLVADASVEENDGWKDKIDAELWEVIEKTADKELIPVYLWLVEVEPEVITTALTVEKGMNPAVYGDEELFNKIVVPKLESEIIRKEGAAAARYKEVPEGSSEEVHPGMAFAPKPEISDLSEYMFDGEEVEDYDWAMSLIDRAISMKVDEYVMAKREIIRREYSAVNNDFIARNVGKKEREVIYNSEYTSTIIVEATKSEIEAYAKMRVVEEISLYVKLIQEPALNKSLLQINADSSTNGTKGNLFNSGAGYKGTGVKIGIIEAGGRFDSSAAQLSGISSSRLIYANDAGPNGGAITTTVPSPTPTNHATMVTSLIVGQSKTVNGVTYEGIVPNATVYQTPISVPEDVYMAIQKLANKGVSVINYSGGRVTGTGYNEYDKEVDRLINDKGVVFVVAAGNENNDGGTGNVLSPGKALNAITVGNAHTKADAAVAYSSPYQIRNTSSYNHASYLPNKPDVAAPGTYISYVSSTGTVTTKSGTSYATPLVAGIAAQIIQAKPFFKTYPELVKSFIVLGAKPDLIKTSTTPTYATDSSNTSNGNYLWTKSGAGLVNAKSAIQLATGNNYTYARFRSSYDVTYNIGSYSAGQTVRIVLVFNKSSNGTISSTLDLDDMDINLINSSGSVLAKSISTKNNVEIIEYKFTSSGTYYVKLSVYRIKDTSTGVFNVLSWTKV